MKRSIILTIVAIFAAIIYFASFWWKGKEIKRSSQEYQDLLDKAYTALYQNEKFKAALLASGKSTLTHSIGRTKETETILTVKEFCSRLTKLREYGTVKEPKSKKLL